MFKKKKINDNIEYLANYNGLNKVSNLVIEECSELIKELTKLNRNIGNLDNVKEEICDVIITIKQLIHCLELTNLDDEMVKKLERALKRIGGTDDRN